MRLCPFGLVTNIAVGIITFGGMDSVDFSLCFVGLFKCFLFRINKLSSSLSSLDDIKPCWC
jgi:hypothetical protein